MSNTLEPNDHIGPIQGRNFVGLNFTEEQFLIVQQAVLHVGHVSLRFNEDAVDPVAADIAEICFRWLGSIEPNYE